MGLADATARQLGRDLVVGRQEGRDLRLVQDVDREDDPVAFVGFEVGCGDGRLRYLTICTTAIIPLSS